MRPGFEQPTVFFPGASAGGRVQGRSGPWQGWIGLPDCLQQLGIKIELPRGHEKIAWAAYWLINGGLVLRVLGEPLTALRPEWGLGWLLGVSALLQLGGGWAFIVSAWPRVRVR